VLEFSRNGYLMSYGDKDTTVHPADLEQVSNCLSRVERKYQPLLDELPTQRRIE